MSWDRDCTILVMNLHDNIKLNGIAELDLLNERVDFKSASNPPKMRKR